MINSRLLKRLKEADDQTTVILRDKFVPNVVAQKVCAFLNSTEGGTVYLIASSQADARALEENEKQDLERHLKKVISPSVLFSVTLENTEDEKVFVINVPPGSDRPYVFDGAIWVRENANTRRARAEDIRAMFGADLGVLRWERHISDFLGEIDLDAELINKTRSRAIETGRLNPENIQTGMDFLQQIGFYRAGGYTNAADVVFSRFPAQRHPQVRVQILQMGLGKVDDLYEHYDWFDGSVLETANRVFEILNGFVRIRAQFIRSSIQREEIRNYDAFAIREGVVNALAHRDYASYSGGVKVSMYSDRIEIWNSGRLPNELRPADLPKKHQSYPVNPDIAHAFYLSGLMEKTGRGAERIAEACKRLGAKAPKWVDDRGGVTLTLFSAFGRKEGFDDLNGRQRAYLDEVKAGDTMTLAEYADRFAPGLHQRQASRDLKELVDFRAVFQEGAGRATLYRRL